MEHQETDEPIGEDFSYDISGEEIYAWMQEIVGIGWRRAGSDQERDAAQYILGKFEHFGLQDCRIESFHLHRWIPQRWSLKILGGASSSQHRETPVFAKPIWYTGSTGDEGTSAEMVYAGYGTPQEFASLDVQGKIALIDSAVVLHYSPTHRHFMSYQSAVRAGALGLVVITDSPDNMIPIFSTEETETTGPIPALMVGNQDGKWVREKATRGGEHLTVRLTLLADLARESTGDVCGVLDGTGDDLIVIGAHYDSVYSGAVDNATGVAALLALAKCCGRMPPQSRSKKIFFVAHPAHEVLVGAKEFVKAHEDVLSRTSVYITLDGIGSDNYDEQDTGVVKTGLDERRGIFISDNPVLIPLVFEAVKKHCLLPAAYVSMASMCPNPDLEGRFYEAGIPVMNIIGKPIWYHTEHDTPDKCTPDQLARATRAHLDIIRAVDMTPTRGIWAADRSLEDRTRLVSEEKTGSAPSVSFNVIPESLPPGGAGIFHVVSFTDPDNILIDLSWDFGDGTTAYGPVVPHSFDKPGEYNVRLTVTNESGRNGSAQQSVLVKGA